MRWLSNTRIKTKFALLIGGLSLGLVLTGFAMARLTSDALLNGRVQALKGIVDVAVGVANSLDKQVQAGKLTKDQALDALRERLLAMTFDNGNGYVYAYTMEGVVVSMPDPKLIGVNRYELKLPNGLMVIKDQIEGLLSSKKDFTLRFSYPKPGETAPSEKIVYSTHYKPWNLMLGTGIYLDDIQAELSSLSKLTFALFAVVILIFAAVATVIALNIARPLVKLNGVMNRLAGGDTSDVETDTARRDEVGDMAKSVQVFRESMAETRELRHQQEDAKRLAETDRKAVLNKLGIDFESAVGQIIQIVSSAAAELEQSANTLTSTAERTEELSTVVASAAREASSNVQSVASASEEMTSSVNEISRQVQESARIAAEAVVQADKTNGRVKELSQAAHKIGDVVELINTIAGQTNLLALNATIEAARAGESGRGFTVVASEVKSLAEQTAKATGEIAEQIKGIQTATAESVQDIQEIGKTIGRISEISSIIAAAVEQQGAATQEISLNVQQASQGTTEVASNIDNVQRGSSETGVASSQVLTSAKALTVESNRLEAEVSKFLNSLRAA